MSQKVLKDLNKF